jgi:hypothetical protein
VPCILDILPGHLWNSLHEDPFVNALPKRLDLRRVTGGRHSTDQQRKRLVKALTDLGYAVQLKPLAA